MNERIVAMVCLTVIVCFAITGLTVTACLTDRDLIRPEVLAFVVTLWIAVMGGMSTWSWLRRHRWRIERTELPDDAG